MEKLTHQDVYPLEHYAKIRADFRARAMAHKKDRMVHIGPNATLHFEDRLSMHYQVQEMLRAERLFEAEEVQGELDAYNPLIPDGTNWKATLMIEYDDIEERQRQLAVLIGIDRKTWVQVSNHARVYAISDEDLERETEDKTSSVHFLRFELNPQMVAAAKLGAAISVGIDHKYYNYRIEPVPESVRASLVRDLAK
jgi:hypothetical protein